MPQCDTCGTMFGTLERLKNHFQSKHSGDVWTPDEHLPGTESQQKDFDGETPNTDGHDPEYENPNDPDHGKRVSLYQFQGDGDDGK